MTRTTKLLIVFMLVTAAAARAAQPTTLDVLNQRLPDVSVRDMPLDQVVDFLAELTHLSIVVRWQTLADIGIPRDQPISLQAKNLRLSQVLWLLMNEAGGGDVKLAYRASGTLLVLSTEQDLGREVLTCVYDVSDLLARIPNAARQGMDLGQIAQGDSGGGVAIDFPAPPERTDGDTPGNSSARATAEMQALIELIRETIEPDTWAGQGGNGTIRAFRTLLVIRNTLLVHQQIGGYVKDAGILGP
jgi:hypothetical protein